MIKAILWKEWKSWRWVFAAFLLAATILPAIPAQVFPNEGATARQFIYFLWFTFSLVVGLMFYQERSRLHFIYSRPMGKAFALSAHYLSYMSMLAALVVLSLSVHYIHMTIKNPGDFSLAEALLEPDLLFSVVLSLFIFSFSIFLAASLLIFGGRKVGAAFASILVLLLLTARSKPSSLASVQSLFAANETPIAFLLLFLCGGIIFAALNVLEISFDEIRDTKNRRWTRAAITASLLSLAMIVATVAAIDQSTVRLSEMGLKKIIVTDNVKHRLMVVMSRHSGENFLASVAEVADSANRTKSWLRNLEASGRHFSFVRGRDEKKLVFLSNKPILGQEIRTFDMENGRVDTVSRTYYSLKQTLGTPFLSSDGDRVADLRTTASRFRNQSAQDLCITKFSSTPLNDSVKLPSDNSASFEPIGWTPDGYDFMLRKTGADGPQIWAVDWVATGARRFLPEFSDSIITEDDLPLAGEWISLLQKDSQGKWTLWLVNYRKGEKEQLGLFQEMPKRAWSQSGTRFAWWSPEVGLHIYAITEAAEQPVICANAPALEQLKWSPGDTKLAIVANEPAASGKQAYLALIDPATCSISKLVANFVADKQQWDWYSENIIVFAEGSELWQVDMGANRTVIASTTSLSKSD